jgi:hypothetical protein
MHCLSFPEKSKRCFARVPNELVRLVNSIVVVTLAVTEMTPVDRG